MLLPFAAYVNTRPSSNSNVLVGWRQPQLSCRHQSGCVKHSLDAAVRPLAFILASQHPFDRADPPPPRSPSPLVPTPLAPQITLIRGTCELMCPLEETRARISEGDVAFFERMYADSKESNEQLMVKKARRNFEEDDRRPEMIRTPAALWRTMEHLRGVMDSDAGFDEIHKFLWDR